MPHNSDLWSFDSSLLHVNQVQAVIFGQVHKKPETQFWRRLNCLPKERADDITQLEHKKQPEGTVFVKLKWINLKSSCFGNCFFTHKSWSERCDDILGKKLRGKGETRSTPSAVVSSESRSNHKMALLFAQKDPAKSCHWPWQKALQQETGTSYHQQ